MDAQFAAGPPDGDGPEVQVHNEPQSPESRFLGAPLQEAAGLARQANPITYIPTSPKLPPFLLASGTNDRLVPHQQTSILATALREHGADVELRLLAGAQHGDKIFETILTAPAIAWLQTLRDGPRGTRS